MNRIVFKAAEVNDNYIYIVLKNIENPYYPVEIYLGLIIKNKERHEFEDNGQRNSYNAEDMRAILNKLDELDGACNE